MHAIWYFAAWFVVIIAVLSAAAYFIDKYVAKAKKAIKRKLPLKKRKSRGFYFDGNIYL